MIRQFYYTNLFELWIQKAVSSNIPNIYVSIYGDKLIDIVNYQVNIVKRSDKSTLWNGGSV